MASEEDYYSRYYFNIPAVENDKLLDRIYKFSLRVQEVKWRNE